MNASKQTLRTLYKQIRDSLTAEECARWSMRICEAITHSPVFEAARTVAVYHPLGSEVDLRPLTKTSQRIVFPRLIDRTHKTMEFATVETAFAKGVFGLMEPDGFAVPKDQIDLILCPGLAFDLEGHRLGYGAGYYDLYLADFQGTVLGVGYACQIAGELPSDPWDIPMQGLFTETGYAKIRLAADHSLDGGE